MSICLCGASAETILDAIALKRMEQLGRAGSESFRACTAYKREVDAALSVLPELRSPVHLLVPDQRRRISDSGRCSHVWSGVIADGSLIRVAPSIFTASPEFNLLLEMRDRSLIDRVLAIMGFCGIFAIDESSEDRFVKRPQLTTVERLRSFAEGLGGGFGSHLLLEAAGFALERARSPLEARFALVLTMPWEMGGFAFPRPELNSRVDVGEKGSVLVGRSSLECDMVWHERRIVLEVNGRLRHEGRFGDDLTKASALEMNGYSVRFVTSQQFRSPHQMLVLGSWLMERLGIEAMLPNMALLEKLLAELSAFEYSRISLPAPHNGSLFT